MAEYGEKQGGVQVNNARGLGEYLLHYNARSTISPAQTQCRQGHVSDRFASNPQQRRVSVIT
jgi:hypothetical protein